MSLDETISFRVPDASDQLVGLVNEVRDHYSADLLRRWVEASVSSLKEFSEEAVRLVQASRAGRTTALIQVMLALKFVQETYLDALRERVAFLDSSPAHFRSAPSGADGPQPGDVRSVFGVAQVYIDGDWWELGSRCEK